MSGKSKRSGKKTNNLFEYLKGRRVIKKRELYEYLHNHPGYIIHLIHQNHLGNGSEEYIFSIKRDDREIYLFGDSRSDVYAFIGECREIYTFRESKPYSFTDINPVIYPKRRISLRDKFKLYINLSTNGKSNDISFTQ